MSAAIARRLAAMWPLAKIAADLVAAGYPDRAVRAALANAVRRGWA
ncbi:MAG: hypothetical protein HQL42_13170 [Alphaproteobacteria bacterium]|nr:hypothetical protein [Alphaproteobacteria bacterium]